MASPPQTLPADFFANQTPAQPSTAPATLPANFDFGGQAPNIIDDPRNEFVGMSNGVPVYRHPDGSPLGRAVSGFWEYTGGGFWDMAKGLASLAAQGAVPWGTLDRNSAGGKLLEGLIRGHIEQAQKAKQVWDEGNHVEALGHTLAAALPLIGPAAAHIGETAGGEQPQFDKYGNVIAPGAEPDIPRAIGQTLGLGTSIAAPEGIKAVAPAAVDAAASAVKVRSSLNPVQQAAIDFLRANDVPLGVGDITGSQFFKNAGAAVGSRPLASKIVKEARNATEAGLQRLSGQLADEAYPYAANPESAGDAIRNSMEEQIAYHKGVEDEAYGDAWKHADNPAFAEEVPVRTEQRPIYDATGRATGKTETVPVMEKVQMPVDVRGIKAQLGPIWEQMSWMPAADQNTSAGYAAAKKILSGPDFIPAQAAEQGLGGLKDMARAPNANLRNTAQGLAAGIVPDLQKGIDAAVAKTGPDALKGLQDGRATHASKMELADVLDNLRKEPVQAFRQATWADDTGIGYLRRIADLAPDALPKVGRGFLTQLFDAATNDGGFSRAKQLANSWDKLGPQTRKLLYPNPGLRGSLDNFFRGAKMIAESPNPSGTALVENTTRAIDMGLGSAGMTLAGMALGHPFVGGGSLAAVGGYLLGGRAIAKLLYSPWGVRLLTEGLKPEGAPAAALRASQILRIAGDDDVTPIPPGGGGGGNPPSAAPAGGSGAAAEEIPSGGGGGASNANSGASAGADGGRAAVSQAAGAGASAGNSTSIPVPGSTQSYGARYAVRELKDIQTSHNGLTFSPNGKYELVNDRDYTRPENQAKVFNGATPAAFDPRYLISDNPDASNGPPVIDSNGNVMGGNGRGMILQRVYYNNPTGAQAYRDLLISRAPNFGLDADQIRGMKQPVLVREIQDEELAGGAQAKQNAVTNFNAKPTAEMRPAEKAIADSRRVSQGTLDDIGERLDAKGQDATLADVLEDRGGADVLQHMIDDGAISPQEAAAYVSNGKLTPAGKSRISQSLLGRFFHDPAQIDRTAPSVRNKLERIAAPLTKAEAFAGWNLTPHVQAALDLLEEARSRGSANLDDVVKQSGLFGEQRFTPQAITLAKAMQSMTPVQLTKAVRLYAQDAKFASEGSGLFGDPPTAQEAFEAAFKQELGPHGPVYRQFQGKPEDAIAWLKEQKNGEAIGALHHPAVGDIDLLWGKAGRPGHPDDDGYGLAHIIAKHGNEFDIGKLQNILDDMAPVAKQARPDRMELESPKYHATVRLNWDGAAKRWLLTTFDRTVPPSAKRSSIIPGNP